MKALRIAIVGAGPVGLALSLLAARQLPGAQLVLFDARPAVRSVVAYLATYAAMYLVSLLVLYVAVDRMSVPEPLGMLATLAVTVPLTFLLLRRGFRTGDR